MKKILFIIMSTFLINSTFSREDQEVNKESKKANFIYFLSTVAQETAGVVKTTIIGLSSIATVFIAGHMALIYKFPPKDKELNKNKE